VEKDSNDSKWNIFPDTVRQEPHTSARIRNTQSILRLTDTKTISFGKSLFGGSKKAGAGTGNTHLTQDLLRARLRRSRNDNLPSDITTKSDTESVIKHLFSDQKLAHHFTNVKNSNQSSLNKDVKAMESAYWPGNEKERVATELKRHGGMRYMMSGPWNETSCEYYEEIQQLALLTASREIARGIATNSVVATAVHARFHQKTMGCAGTLATARRRVHAMDFAAHSREEARATIEAAKVTNTKPSHYSWSPAELDVNRRNIYELEFHHSRPFRH
jgi:hypothetical protein